MALLVVFVATRAAMLYLAVHRARYQGQTYITGDISLYRAWADPILHHAQDAYADVRVQYPPGSLPFMLGPDVGSPGPRAYLLRFAAVMAAVDAAALAGLYVLARRRGSAAGMWAWTVTLPALGPILYDRVDLPPAAATVWGLVAADGGWWLAAGAWFGFAAAAKLYPVLLLPELLAFARRRARAAVGFVALVVAALLPFWGELGSLWTSVLSYHSARGIQVESDWGLGLLFAAASGYPARVVYDFGSFNVITTVSDTLKRAAEAASVAAAVLGAVVAWLRRSGGAAALTALCYGTLGLVMCTGTVLSPQYLVWLMALGAVGAALERRMLWPVALLVPAAAITQVLYPFFYGDLLTGDTVELVLLAVRNGLLALSAVAALGVAVAGGPARPAAAGLLRAEG